MKATARNISLTGVGFIGASFVLYAALRLWLLRHPLKFPYDGLQYSPVGMILSPATLFSAAMGMSCLVIGGLMLTYNRLRVWLHRRGCNITEGFHR